ncbi:hypothetical protein BV20DRAFT_962514 [Pilatotrama ljubarskyi]|nr:hypothetical protein BV20DRAFT_962514 [Pilatotrama ljubarskyi]
MYRSARILTLPSEINQAIFSYLDGKTLRSCALTCRRWAPSAQYILFRHAKVDSLGSARRLLCALRESPHLRDLVKELTICGRLKDTVKSWISGDIDLVALIPSPALLPRLRAFRFEYWDPVQLSPKFWTLLREFRGITALHLRCCYFYVSHQIEDLIFAFPRLGFLTLDSVRWGGDREKLFVRRPGYQDRVLALRKLSICNPYEYGPIFQWLKAHQCLSVRHLELIRFGIFNVQRAAAYVQGLGSSLESLTVGLYLPAWCDPSARFIDLGHNKRLRTLSLQIYDVTEHSVLWVCSVLASAMELPLARIEVSLTLDHRKTLWTGAWGAIHNALTTYWRPTLREVVFTHHAVPGFLQDAAPLLRERFSELEERGVLSVVVDVQDS